MREFETGATRDSDDAKLDYEGFLAPKVLARFAQYMHQHRIQSNGEVRDSDNWQKGIPKEAYMKSMWRHFMEVWTIHRKYEDITHEEEAALQEALCAMMFNVMGYLFEEVTRVGMHLPGMPEDPAAEKDPALVTTAPTAALGDLEDGPVFKASDQTAPAHDETKTWNPDGGYFTPAPPPGAPTNTGKGCGA